MQHASEEPLQFKKAVHFDCMKITLRYTINASIARDAQIPVKKQLRKQNLRPGLKITIFM